MNQRQIYRYSSILVIVDRYPPSPQRRLGDASLRWHDDGRRSRWQVETPHANRPEGSKDRRGWSGMVHRGAVRCGDRAPGEPRGKRVTPT